MRYHFPQTCLLLPALGVLLILLSGCTTTHTTNTNAEAPANESILGKALPYTSDYYLDRAQTTSSPASERHYLLAAQAFLQAVNNAQAQQILNSLHEEELSSELIAQKQLLQARLNLVNNQTKQALSMLRNLPAQQLAKQDQKEFRELLAAAYARGGNHFDSVRERVALDTLVTDPAAKQYNQQELWSSLQQLSLSRLQNYRNQASVKNDATLLGWLDLAILAKQYADDDQGLAQQISLWKQVSPEHPAQNLLSGSESALSVDKSVSNLENKIVLLLPLHGSLAAAGQAVKNGFMAAYYADSKNANKPEIDILDTNRNTNIVTLYKEAIAKNARFIAGPLSRDKVDQLLMHGDISVPTLALNYSHSPYASHPQFFQFGLSPLDEARQAAQYAWQASQSRIIIITPTGQWGKDVADAFASTFRGLGGTIVERLAYDSKDDMSTAIKHLLRVDDSQQRADELQKSLHGKLRFIPHRRDDFNAFFLVANPHMARQIRPMLKFYFAGDVPVFATSSVYPGISVASANRDLEGVLFCDIPWVLNNSNTVTAKRRELANLWPNNYNQYIRLYALGMDTYRLSQMPSRLTNYPNLRIQGATGALTMDSKQRIHRQLDWVQVRKGELVTLS
jgi:uncharacterized protein